MAFKLKIKKSETNLSNRFKDELFAKDKFRNRIAKSKDDIKEYSDRKIVEYLEKTPFMKGMSANSAIGIRGDDLGAEFGLSDSDRDEAYRRIKRALSKTTKVTINRPSVFASSRGNLSTKYSIETKFLDEEDYIDKFNGDPFEYSSKNGIIEWMHWVLNGRSGQGTMESSLTDITKYGIIYDLSDKEKRNSRSGRALMFYKSVKNRQRAGKAKRKARIYQSVFEYKFPSAARPDKGKNFIESLALNDSLLKVLERHVISVQNSILKRQ